MIPLIRQRVGVYSQRASIFENKNTIISPTMYDFNIPLFSPVSFSVLPRGDLRRILRIERQRSRDWRNLATSSNFDAADVEK